MGCFLRKSTWRWRQIGSSRLTKARRRRYHSPPTDIRRFSRLHFLPLRGFAEQGDGIVRFNALRLRLWSGKYREPDILYLSARRRHLRGERFWEGADWVLEVRQARF